jgi:hypothetical protein
MSGSRRTIKQSDLFPQVEAALRELPNFTATLVLGDKRAASGVFVNTCGFNGILTAYHVAKPLLEFEYFGLCIAGYFHRLWLPSKHFEHVVVGQMQGDPNKRKDGPDLSFIIIKDNNLLSDLNSRKSFCFLESQPLAIFENPLEQLAWAVTGCPSTYKEETVEGNNVMLSLPNFTGHATFQGQRKDAQFDYVELSMQCDGTKFPANFEGLSGGGLWAITFKKVSDEPEPKCIAALPPVLAGIAFYQSEPHDNCRVITGHGFESIYGTLREVLRQRQVT